MKELNGRELSLYIKERQAHEVRRLRQSKKVFPKLAIVRTNPDPVVDSYMNLKQAYGADILVEVGIHTVKQADCIDTIKELNADDDVHAIIVQIPLPDPSQTDEVLNSVSPSKDVDGLGKNSRFDPATPMAINWLLAGYNVELSGKKIVIVGQGRLVGKPLAKIWRESNLDVEVADKTTNDLANVVSKADVLVSATGVPGLIKQEMIMPGMTIVDAGVATDSNGLVGDVAAEVRELKGITITPEKGGVGPLTVCALFENVITAARNIAETQ
ncbi:bifunctional 5,10-methylenetetrahydrofolate dehydrogenase/5,10-methenyltetrahydrofolate cyclohydrolase [Candidatus Saccharibacteria bacterium]|jgi:methylenetetrahydrofolate dehydrogenase (NADP+)/methenyltetrahydrofolate cyclohydrolase|nr:MAG: bifunctional 5,10-methylenetetrahydrofolate dehydrogenase/5,10-methenyltetrahydrofolate cyclohydrolase [Candidatus Saccharibacteria bacterium]